MDQNTCQVKGIYLQVIREEFLEETRVVLEFVKNGASIKLVVFACVEETNLVVMLLCLAVLYNA